MSSEFVNMLLSEVYISALSGIEHGRNTPPRGYIFVENEMDILFWEKLLPDNITLSYSFSTGTGDGGIDSGVRGITRFFNHFNNASKLSIFAIDADHYFFKRSSSPAYQQIIDNQFILHTYGYSKESLLNSIESLNECLSNFRFFHKSDYDFSIFLTRDSTCIYEPFIKFAYSLNKSTLPFESEDKFYELIKPNEELMFNFNQDVWDKFKHEMILLSQHIAVDNEHEFLEFKASTSRIGLAKQNTYLFINGHFFEEKIIKDIISKIKRTLIEKENERVKNQGLSGAALGYKIREINNFFSENCRFSTLRNQCVKFKDNPLYTLVSGQFNIFTQDTPPSTNH